MRADYDPGEFSEEEDPDERAKLEREIRDFMAKGDPNATWIYSSLPTSVTKILAMAAVKLDRLRDSPRPARTSKILAWARHRKTRAIRAVRLWWLRFGR